MQIGRDKGKEKGDGRREYKGRWDWDEIKVKRGK
jgi:hypothetical protein